MNTEALILNWTKRSVSSGWTVRVELPSGALTDIPIGGKKGIPAGKVLSLLLPDIQEIPEQYPFQYNMATIRNQTVRKLHLRFLGDRPVQAEVSLLVADFLRETMHQTNWVAATETVPSSDIHFSQLQNEYNRKAKGIIQTFSNQEHTASEEYAEHENRYWIFIDPKNIDVLDGDTIQGYIDGYGWPAEKAIPNYIGKQKMKEQDQKVDIRYLGVNTFETTHGSNPDIYRNNEKSKLYGVQKEVLDKAAIEAQNMNQALLEKSSLLAISLQYNTFTDEPEPDYYGRLLGVVYATRYSTAEEAALALREGIFQGVNVNKELLKPMYSRYQEILKITPVSVAIPLAEFTGNLYAKEQHGLNISQWAAELNLSLPPDKDTLKNIQKSVAQQQENLDELQQNAEDQKSTYVFNGHMRKDEKLAGYINNDLSFVPPRDDRILDAKIYGPVADQEETLPWDYLNRVRIGDVFIPIPPLSIRMDKQYQTENVQTMRAKSSLQKNIGSVRNILSMDLYFASDEDINGEKVVGHYTKNKGTVSYYMDGLRPLLAQFKKAPFLPIDNEYVNKKLGVHNVALRNLQVETVPGFPEAMKATLILEEFDSQPYLMGEHQLGSLINYPLLRWHYQRLLHKPTIYEPWRTYLPPIEQMDNHFTFSIVNENQLRKRREAIREFRDMQTPSEFKREITNLDKDYGQLNTDLLNAQTIIEEYERFMQEWKDKTILKKYGLDKSYSSPQELPVVMGQSLGWDKAINLIKSYSPKETSAGIEIAQKIYGKDDENGNISKKRVSAFAGWIAQVLNTPADSFFSFRAITSGAVPISWLPKHLYDTIKENNFPGYFQIYLTSEENKKLFPDCKVHAKDAPTAFLRKDELIGDRNGELYIIPAGDVKGSSSQDYLTKFKTLAKEAAKVEKRIENYEQEYNALASRINQTEETLAMDPYLISDIIPISLTVGMENTFSTVQVQAAQTPTMQFFGAMDPEVLLTFETSDAGVAELEELFRRIGFYVREYREGLSTGFMGVSNPLVAMFGIQNVMPRNVQYDTVAGHPDRKIVTLTCSAFDKTQRRQEALYGYVGGNINDTLRDRAYDNYDPSKDGMYVHERMRQMELYPDLEMPKIKELEEVLPFLNADIKKWENRTNQVFLDPDFYISTEHTYRKFLKDFLDSEEDITFRWEDAQGFVIDSSLRNENPLQFVDGYKSAEDFENDLKNTPYVDPSFEWEEEVSSPDSSEERKTSSVFVETAKVTEPDTTFSKEEVKKFVRKAPKEPSLEEWKKWSGNSGKSEKDYSGWKKTLQKDISPVDFWYELADAVMESFSSSNLEFASFEDTLIRNRGNAGHQVAVDTHNTEQKYILGKALGKLAWMDSNEYFQKIVNGISWTKKRLENGKEIEDDAFGFWEEALNVFSNENPYPYQRVVSYVRALIQVESGGKQTDGGKPLLYDKNKDGIPTKAGIAGAKLTHAQSESEAQRLIWDWRYNLRTVVKELAGVFKEAESSPYKDIFAHRMDWAIASRSWSELPKILSSKDGADDVPKGYLDGPINPERNSLHQKVERTREIEMAMVGGDIAPPLYTDINGRVIPEILAMYTSMSYQSEKDKEKVDNIVDGIGDKIERNTPIGTLEERLKGMFVDMYQHDQTGRLLRAFPSFSLQLIDEGKWYSNFRTWDNFYGYNALHSIDVYKSRKIAADTAVVEMSNMYGGLTAKRKDMEYPDLALPSFFSSQFLENYVMGIPTEEQMEARKEIFKSMMLEAGARLHVRMGYGSDARYLPVVFNGTITEVSTGDIVTIVAQGDALELTNTINGNPEDTNKRGLFNTVIEPYDFIGELMTSKGNWLKDIINNQWNGKYFKDSPLGIAHFGSPVKSPDGTWKWFNDDFGESLQNVYSQNGMGAKSQWLNEDGSSVSGIRRIASTILPTDIQNLAGDNDEDNIVVKIYGSTPWDIIQTFALCTHDYLAGVIPFQFRSSLFFGKPTWPVIYDYDSTFSYDEGTGKWRRELTQAHRKTFMQAHLANSYYNLVSNDMKVSAEGVYNNVIVEYDGHVTPPLQADNDIRLDQQRTANVQANIVARKKGIVSDFLGYWTTEAQASRYGHSTVRDFMKDMYKGSYTVLGDATVKPHDCMFLSDVIQDIQGTHLVKAVQHSMSLETGFVSIIEPDACVINFDTEGIFMVDKAFSVLKDLNGRAFVSAGLAGVSFGLGGSVVGKLLKHLGGFAGSLQKLGGKIPENYVAGIIRAGNSYHYQAVGHFLGDNTLIEFGKHLGKLDVNIDVSITTSMSQYLKGLKNSWQTVGAKEYQETKTAYKAFKKGRTAGNAFKINEAAGTVKVIENLEDATKAYEGVLAAKKTADRAKLIHTASEAGKATNAALQTTGKLIRNVLSKPFVWGIIFQVALEALTSTLLEMWSRRKQNAECVKVFPLQYKGKPWVAAMAGHRGSVWGDAPSISDKWWHAQFGDGDEDTKGLYYFIPKLVNFFAGETLSDSAYQQNKAANEEKD